MLRKPLLLGTLSLCFASGQWLAAAEPSVKKPTGKNASAASKEPSRTAPSKETSRTVKDKNNDRAPKDAETDVPARHVEPKATAKAAPPKEGPTVEEALSLAPRQKGVDYDRPADAKGCKLESIENGGGVLLRDAQGQVLRTFADTNNDGRVDQWSYYKDGLEVYRDLDTDFNGRPDQCRWFNTAGTRWGLDKNEDSLIDSWKTISAEEVTAEIVAAISEKNPKRFERLLVTEAELQHLGAGPELTENLTKRVGGASAAFQEFLTKQDAVTPQTHWVYFGGSRPGIVPAGTKRSTKDLQVYENVAAMIDTDGKSAQITIGALVKVGDVWRAVDAPPLNPEKVAAAHVFFPTPDIPSGNEEAPASVPGQPTEAERKLLAEIDQLDKQIDQAAPDQQAALQARHADMLEKLCKQTENPTSRAQWMRQLIDTIGAGVQTGTYPTGTQRLEKLAGELQASKTDAELVAHANYALMMAKYTQSLSGKEPDFEKIQKEWMETLKGYLNDYPNSPDAADALMQLATAYEFAGEDAQAITCYDRLAKIGSGTAQQKALGAKTRLESEGKGINLKGKDLSGNPFDLTSKEFQNKVVLIHYWRTDYDVCRRDLATIKDLYDEYQSKGLRIVGVSLDEQRDELQQFVQGKRITWSQLHENGGLDSRLACEMGIINLPTMILVGPNGKVVSTRVTANDLEGELKKLLNIQQANRKVK